MDPETIDQLRTEPRKDLYNHQYLISGKEGTGRKSFFKGRTQIDVIDRTRLFILNFKNSWQVRTYNWQVDSLIYNFYF